MRTKLTAPAIRARKVRDGGDPLVMVTAYDAPGARMADEAGVDLILVGDSVAMVVLGYDDTLQVTVDDLAHHTAAVARAGLVGARARGQEALRRRRPAVDELPHHRRRHRPQRRPAHPGRRPGREARGRPQAAPDDRGDHRRRDPGDGPPRPHPAVACTPWAASRCRAASTAPPSSWWPTPRRSPRPGASPSCSRACPTRSPAWSPTPSTSRPSASAPAPARDGQVLVFHDVLGIEDRILPKFVRRYAVAQGRTASTPSRPTPPTCAPAPSRPTPRATTSAATWPRRWASTAALPSASRAHHVRVTTRPGAPTRRLASCVALAGSAARRAAGAVGRWTVRRTPRRRPPPSAAPGDPDRRAPRGLRRGRRHRRPGRRPRPAGLVPARGARRRAAAPAGPDGGHRPAGATRGWCSCTRRTSTNGFYMRNTPMPLSIAWVAADGEVVVDRRTWSRARTATAARPTPPTGPTATPSRSFQGGLDDLGITEARHRRPSAAVRSTAHQLGDPSGTVTPRP